jgi:hypothetical protein
MSDFDLEKHVKPKEIIAIPGDAEQGLIEVHAMLTSPFLLFNWRRDQFFDAVETTLRAAGVLE